MDGLVWLDVSEETAERFMRLLDAISEHDAVSEQGLDEAALHRVCDLLEEKSEEPTQGKVGSADRTV